MSIKKRKKEKKKACLDLRKIKVIQVEAFTANTFIIILTSFKNSVEPQTWQESFEGDSSYR